MELAFSSQFLTNFAPRIVDVGPPPAQIHYRIVDPADYQLEVTTTNWTRRARPHFRFSFKANIPGKPNPWTTTPRGTVVLLHGYGLAQYSTVPGLCGWPRKAGVACSWISAVTALPPARASISV